MSEAKDPLLGRTDAELRETAKCLENELTEKQLEFQRELNIGSLLFASQVNLTKKKLPCDTYVQRERMTEWKRPSFGYKPTTAK